MRLLSSPISPSYPFQRIVETTGARMFGLEEAEVQERRAFVEHVRREIEVRPMPARLHHAHYDDTEG